MAPRLEQQILRFSDLTKNPNIVALAAKEMSFAELIFVPQVNFST